jgi:pimeloyl-ACP methyl ester carboxylesterase
MITPPTDGQRWRPPLEDVLDPVFERMGTPPMIVVVPDGWSQWGCGQWVDSPVTGNFEQYFIHDVVESVDATYRTLPGPRSRGVFGFSSGGFGAWNLASRNPDVFGAMAVLSADSFRHDPQVHAPQVPRQHLARGTQRPGRGQLLVGDRLRLCSVLLTQPGPPFYVDLPVAFPSGELIQEVWDRWLSFDPVVNVHDRLDNLRKLSGILLDAGSKDDYNLHWGHRLLSHHLHEAGIAHEIRENPVNHGGRWPERHQMALQWLSQVLDAV